MTRDLPDTNHASLLFRRVIHIMVGVRAAVDGEFALCRPSIGELWFMVYNSARVAANEREMELFLGDFALFEFDAAAAMEFGRIKAELRTAGRPIPDVDAQIAAIAGRHDLVILAADAHFASVRGIRTDNWA